MFWFQTLHSLLKFEFSLLASLLGQTLVSWIPLVKGLLLLFLPFKTCFFEVRQKFIQSLFWKDLHLLLILPINFTSFDLFSVKQFVVTRALLLKKVEVQKLNFRQMMKIKDRSLFIHQQLALKCQIINF